MPGIVALPLLKHRLEATATANRYMQFICFGRWKGRGWRGGRGGEGVSYVISLEAGRTREGRLMKPTLPA